MSPYFFIAIFFFHDFGGEHANDKALLSVSSIALFTDNILHLHYNETERECEAISGKNDKIARNCLVSTLNCIVLQMSKVICEKGYSFLVSLIKL